MSKFHTPLSVVQIDNKRWELQADLIYSSDLLQRVIVVPKGFITDFASVPRLPLAYLLAGGKGDAAACVHDWGYSSHDPDDRAAWDGVLQEAIQALGYSKWEADLMWAGVRLFGWMFYDKRNLEQPDHIDLPESF